MTSVKDCIGDFERALELLERAELSKDPKGIARAVHHGRMALYTISRRLEHLQPTADEWAQIDERMGRLERVLAKHDP